MKAKYFLKDSGTKVNSLKVYICIELFKLYSPVVSVTPHVTKNTTKVIEGPTLWANSRQHIFFCKMEKEKKFLCQHDLAHLGADNQGLYVSFLAPCDELIDLRRMCSTL